MEMGAKPMPETAENPQMPSGAQINKTPKERGSDRPKYSWEQRPTREVGRAYHRGKGRS